MLPNLYGLAANVALLAIRFTFFFSSRLTGNHLVNSNDCLSLSRQRDRFSHDM